jgi:hypothetical protein
MTTKIITKNSQTPASAPLAGDLEVGELAVNTADQLLYTKQTDGTIIEVGKTTELETLKAPKASPVFTGNVGIGTTTPTEPLTVIAREISAGGGGIGVWNFDSTQKYNIQTGVSGVNDTNLAIRNDTTSTDMMVFAPSGNVGIGTAVPASLLTVGTYESSGFSADGSLFVKTTATNDSAIVIQENSGTEQWSLGVNVDGDLNFLNSGNLSDGVTFADNGNVGIGTSSPSQKLEVRNLAASSYIQITGPAAGVQGVLLGDTGSLTSGRVVYSNVDNSMQIWTANAERMRIDTAGDVEVTTLNKGVIVKSPNGTRWRITVDNAGNIATATV